MKQVSGIPTSGQFVAVWSLNGTPLSAAYKWELGHLNVYSIFDDEWEKVDYPLTLKSYLDRNNALYFIAD